MWERDVEGRLSQAECMQYRREGKCLEESMACGDLGEVAFEERIDEMEVAPIEICVGEVLRAQWAQRSVRTLRPKDTLVASNCSTRETSQP